MPILWGVAAGVALGSVIGVAVFFWQVESSDGNLLDNF